MRPTSVARWVSDPRRQRRKQGGERSAAVGVQRSRTAGKAHTGHRKPGCRTNRRKPYIKAQTESCLRNQKISLSHSGRGDFSCYAEKISYLRPEGYEPDRANNSKGEVVVNDSPVDCQSHRADRSIFSAEKIQDRWPGSSPRNQNERHPNGRLSF